MSNTSLPTTASVEVRISLGTNDPRLAAAEAERIADEKFGALADVMERAGRQVEARLNSVEVSSVLTDLRSPARTAGTSGQVLP